MKPLLLLSLILTYNLYYSFSQDTIINVKTDSSGIEKPSQLITDIPLGAVIKISSDDFNKGVAFTPMQLIQGKVPGFTINCLNGNDPNANIQIQLRGTSTLFISTEPLYIVDGIPLKSPDIILPENIESIEVLKSLSETAPYGIRGGNGVVLIQTKKNNSRKLTFTYSMYGYAESYAKKSDYLTASEWRQLKNDWAISPFSRLSSNSRSMFDYNGNTDWVKEISQKKLSQAHNLGISGAYKKTSYSAILNYSNRNGIIQKTGNDIFSGQLAVSQLAMSDKLQVDLSFIGTSRKYSRINDNPYLNSTDLFTGQVLSNILSSANSYNPTISLYNPDGSFGRDTLNEVLFYEYNPLNLLSNTTDERTLNNMLAGIQVSYEIAKGLKFSTLLSENINSIKNTFSNRYQRKDNGMLFLKNKNETNNEKEYLFNVKLDYSKSLGDHHFDLLLDYSFQRNNSKFRYVDSMIVNDTINSTSGNNLENLFDIKSISGEAKYNYKNKYYLSIGLLQEKSPLFNWKENGQYFPSISAAWAIDNEGYLKEIGWLSECMIRAGYGVGQRSVKNLIYSGSNFAPNPDLHGENTAETNVGVDICLLSNRICISADYYNRKTKDGILIKSIPNENGYLFISNDLKIQNKGWEFDINTQPLVNSIKWTCGFNISINKNRVLSDSYLDPNLRIEKDRPVGDFYGYQFAGYSLNDRPVIYTENGDTTSLFSQNYERVIGNGTPKSYFGFTNNFSYESFDLSIFVRGALGFNIKNSNRLGNDIIRVNANSSFKREIVEVDPRDVINYAFLVKTDYVIEKGDYLKIAAISLGYSIPVKKRFIQSAKVYIACNNVAIFTRYKGGDPEAAGITGATPGTYLYDIYPVTRLYVLGLKITI